MDSPAPPSPSPGEGDPAVGRHHVVVRLLGQAPHQAEVADLGGLAAGQHDVAGGQVAVDEVPPLQVLHAGGDLRGQQPEARQGVVILPRPQRLVQGAQRGQLRYLGDQGGGMEGWMDGGRGVVGSRFFCFSFNTFFEGFLNASF